MVIGNFGHCLHRAVGQSERTPCKMHPSEPEVPLRVHPQMVLAMQAERSVRHTDCCTNVGYVERFVRICLENLFEPPHDRHLRTPLTEVLRRGGLRQTGNGRARQRLLYGLSDRRVGKNVGGICGQIVGRFLQAQQLRHQDRRWT